MNMFNNKSKSCNFASIVKQSALALAMASALVACGDDSSSASDEPNSEGKKYALGFMMDNSMLVGTGSFSADQSSLVKDFIETNNSASVGYFNGSLYILNADESGNGNLARYELDKDNNVPEKPAATAKFKGTSAMMFKFVDKKKMYVNQTMGNAIVSVDPVTLKKINTIDFSKYLEEGALMIAPGSSVVRDGKLYQSLGQIVYMNENSIMTGGSAMVAIIDIATDKIEKVIREDATSSLGIYDDMNNTMAFVDENGDIYFYALGSLGFVEGQTEGWVRIKKGKTEFDKDWVFHLHDAAYDGKKKNENYLMAGGTYIGDGKFMGFFGNFSDPNNFYALEWNFVVIDLKKKTIEKVDLSPTIPWFAASIHTDTDGSVFIGHSDGKKGAIYRYRDGKVEKEMDVSTGTAYYVVPLED